MPEILKSHLIQHQTNAPLPSRSLIIPYRKMLHLLPTTRPNLPQLRVLLNIPIPFDLLNRLQALHHGLRLARPFLEPGVAVFSEEEVDFFECEVGGFGVAAGRGGVS